jgi:hypothetical protein
VSWYADGVTYDRSQRMGHEKMVMTICIMHEVDRILHGLRFSQCED